MLGIWGLAVPGLRFFAIKNRAEFFAINICHSLYTLVRQAWKGTVPSSSAFLRP